MTPDLDLIALVKEGKVAVVPVEADPAMLKAAGGYADHCAVHNYGGPPDADGTWDAMLSASPTLTPALLALIKERDRLREALDRIAAFGDLHASRKLAQTGSYGGFDEPGSVEIARRALTETRHDG